MKHMTSRRRFIKTGLIFVPAGLLAPKFLNFMVGDASAASTILARTISSVADKRIVLSNSQFGRAHGIATWTQLRIGLRLIMGTTGANIVGPFFYVGLCSGTTNMIMDPTTDNWCGIRNTGDLLYDSNGPPNLYHANGRATKRVGSTITDNATCIGNMSICNNAIAAVISGHTAMFVDITKGSPNYTFNIFSKTVNANPVSITQADFLGQLAVATPSLTQHASGTAKTLAVDESTGAFTHINIGWDQAAPTIEICDLAVVRLA